jgi:hypothetical protein
MNSFEGIDLNSVALCIAMFLLGLGAGTAWQYRRVGLFIERLQAQLNDRGSYKVRVSTLYKLRVMLFGVPKNPTR